MPLRNREAGGLAIVASFLLFKGDKNTPEKNQAWWDFSSPERNHPIGFHPSLFCDLSKRINHGYQGLAHQLQLSVFTFFCSRLPSPKALLSQFPIPAKRRLTGKTRNITPYVYTATKVRLTYP